MVTQTPDGKVLFQFYRPGARQVAIAGDFNGWQHSFQMTGSRDGWWRSHVELAPGTYRFRYMADGEWFTDYAAFGLEQGPFGWNSVIQVDKPRQDVLAAAMEEPVAPPTPVRIRPTPAPRPMPAPAPVRELPPIAVTERRRRAPVALVAN